MTTTFRRITRGAFADRLGIFAADFTPRQGSHVADAVTRFYDMNGQQLGYAERSKCPITGKYEDQFFILTETAEPDEAHSSIWL